MAHSPAMHSRGLLSKGWQMARLEDPPVAEIHMHAARQAWIEAADGAHNVDAFKRVESIFLEQWGILDGVLEGAGGAERIAWTGIPGCRRIWMVVGDDAVAN